MPITSYRDLDAWKVGMDIARGAYTLTRSFPKDELFGLTSQLRRAAVSIPANIAEGHGRESTQDFMRFLRIAQGSLKELETLLTISADTGATTPEASAPMLELADREGRILRALLRSLADKDQS
ncbi:MAG: four helix bundle protein [Planctomycetota bacterium]|nr:four helix bundle protein [Planctomycetota bacterium]